MSVASGLNRTEGEAMWRRCVSNVVVALKLLVIWRDDARRAERVEMCERFVADESLAHRQASSEDRWVRKQRLSGVEAVG